MRLRKNKPKMQRREPLSQRGCLALVSEGRRSRLQGFSGSPRKSAKAGGAARLGRQGLSGESPVSWHALPSCPRPPENAEVARFLLQNVGVRSDQGGCSLLI